MSLPPSEVPQGAIRFNTDSQRLEFYAQGEWWVMSTDTPNLAQSGEATPGARGLIGGGYIGTPTTAEIMFWNIASLSAGEDFGNLTESRGYTAGVSSRTRAVWGGGHPAVDTIDYVTMASTGNATAFGELNDGDRYHMGSASNQTRGIFAGGESPSRVDIIEYLTIASTGDSIDFGNLSSIREAPGGVNSPTRAVFAGGANPGALLNAIEFVTISTLGDSQDFGDLSQIIVGNPGGSNAVRGLFGGGANPSDVTIINKITIPSGGNAVRFGDLTVARRYGASASSPTRCTWVGGIEGSSVSNVMDYVEFATEGNAVDFGDLNNAQNPGTGSGCSNAHGGL